MSQAPYKYTVTIDLLSFEVFPVGVDKLEYDFSIEDKEIFFRKKLSAALVFVNDPVNNRFDFDTFRDIELSPTQCTEIKLTISKLCENNYIEDWKGFFTTAMGKFDLDECTFEVLPLPDDQYRCLLSNINKEINILDVSTLHSSQVELDTGAVYEYYYFRGNSISCALNNPGLPVPTNSWNGLHQETDNDPNGDKICIFFREKITTNCVAGVANPPPGTGWQLLEDNCAVSGDAIWVRRPASVVTNPNPRVLKGLCDSGTALPPPPQVKKAITLVSPPALTATVNDIRGYKQVCLAVTLDFTYDIDPFPNSTFAWSSAGANMTITSATTDPLVTVHYGASFSGGTLTCEETTSCGDVITHELIIGIGEFLANGRMFSGPVNLCPDQLATWTLFDAYKISGGSRYNGRVGFFNVMFAGGPNVLGLSYFGTILVNTRDELTVQFNSAPPAIPGSLEMHWTSEFVACNPNSIVDDEQPLFISSVPLTDAIAGPATACNGALGVIYSVENRPGSTYVWEVDGGTIFSGQGSNQIEVDFSGVDGSFEIRVKETIDCGCAYILIVDCEPGVNNTPYWLCPEIKYNQTYDRNRSLPEVIEYMLSQLDCSTLTGDLISDLLEWNPDGTAPGYIAGRNYVYGGVNQYSNLMIAQKSDIISPTASNPATRGIWTLRKLFDYFRSFDIFWFVDDSGNLRIEHFIFFPFPVGLDLTHPRWAEWVKKKNKYSHDAQNIPKYERWIEEALFQDFVGQEIRYEALCVSQDPGRNVLEYNLPDVTADLNYIALRPEEIQRTGFVIMACDASDNVISDVGVLSGLTLANQPMSIATLQDRFCRHNRYLPEGIMNSNLEQFDGFRSTIKQVDLSIPLCCESFVPTDAIVTELGTKYLSGVKARVLSAKYELYSGALTLKLGYSYANL